MIRPRYSATAALSGAIAFRGGGNLDAVGCRPDAEKPPAICLFYTRDYSGGSLLRFRPVAVGDISERVVIHLFLHSSARKALD